MAYPPISQQQALDTLCSVEPSFIQIIEQYGTPPLWHREEGFATLIQIILEQQVSLASAKAAFDRLEKASNPLTPGRFLQFSDSELKTIGFSRQKTLYGRHLATALEEEQLKLDSLHSRNDDDVRRELTKIKGIGIWTSNIYLLMALQRPDIWPKGDIALAAAYRELKQLEKRPSSEAMETISVRWAPYRSAAARLLYHYYLSRREIQTG